MSMNDFIPDGFLPLAKWDHRKRGNNDGHSTEWKALGDAVKGGEVPGFRLSNGRWYVHEDQANEFLARTSEPQKPAKPQHKPSPAGLSPAHAEAAVIALCEINNGISLMQSTLERLTAAVELIATQPRTAQQDLIATFESNGFHQ